MFGPQALWSRQEIRLWGGGSSVQAQMPELWACWAFVGVAAI